MKLARIAAAALIAILLIACRAPAYAGNTSRAPTDGIYSNNTAGDAPTSPVPPGNSSRAVRPPGSGAVRPQPPADLSVTVWRVYYFDVPEPQGPPLAEGSLAQPYLDAHWLDALPDDGLAARAQAASWVRDVDLAGGALRFYVWADGGVRLWVNGRLIVDRWESAEANAAIGDIWLDRAGPCEILLAYRDMQGPGRIRLWWETTLWFAGWRGEYYPNRYLTGQPVMVRNDAIVAFDWGLGAPAPSLPADDFSVRWTRSLNLAPGCYRLMAEADDGVRVYVDDMLLINAWQDKPSGPLEQVVWVPGGEQAVVIEYFDASETARIAVDWELLATATSEAASPQGCDAWAGAPGSASGDAVVLSDLVGDVYQAVQRFYYRLVEPPAWW